MAATTPKSNGRKLTLTALAEAKRLPAEFLSDLGLKDLPQGGVGIPYYGPTGKEIAVKQRTALMAKEGSYWPKSVPLAAYGQRRIDEASQVGFLILVEGESDCWVLWHHGLPALGVPGANCAKVIEREHVEAVPTIYCHREPDSGGEKFAEGVRLRLAILGWEGKLFELRMPDGVKDPADLHAADPDRFLARLKEAIQASTVVQTPKSPVPKGKSPPGTLKKQVRAINSYRPFPVELLPEPLQEFVRQGAAALGCDAAYVALPALGAIAGAIGNTRAIRLKHGWVEPSVCWATLVADSGTLKSPGWDLATRPLFRRQGVACDEHEAELRQFLDAMATWEKENKKRTGNPGQKPEKPVLQHLLVSDTTVEKLGEILADSPRGVLLARDELGAWLSSFQRYKGKSGGSDLHHWLEAFHARSWKIDRKTGDRKTLFVRHATVSIAGSLTPGVLTHALTPEFLDAGLAARLLMAMPPKRPKRWTEACVHPAAEQSYDKLLDKLLKLEADTDPDGNPAPFVLELSPDARKVWVAFYNQWAAEQAASEGEVASALSKLEAYAARFTLLHHVVGASQGRPGQLDPVSPASVEAGAALARWFGAEARRIYGTLSESKEERDTRRLVEFITMRGGRITARQLQRANGRKYTTGDAAEAALEALVQAGLALWQDRPATPQGGKRARVLALCPTSDTSDTCSVEEEEGEAPWPASLSDTTSDTPSETLEKPGKNDQVSEVSDVGQGVGTPGGQALAGHGPLPVVSDSDPRPGQFPGGVGGESGNWHEGVI